MRRISVMHITDTLSPGGTERVAVNLVNLLACHQRAGQQYLTYLCTTRWDGPLAELVAADVGRLRLGRRGRFDWAAIRRLADFVHTNQIQLLHAHSSSLFIAAIVSRFPPPKGKPHPSVIWHDHFGRHMVEDRPAWLYRLAAKHVSGVIAVNQPLAEWSQRKLHIPANRVWYIPNFVCEVRSNGAISGLPGKAGQRIVCVANLRSEKDHLTLLRAMALVIRQVPTAHLLLAGATIDRSYVDLLHNEISRNGLSQNVSLLGQRQDVEAMLRACDIGVLSSASEGLPLALMEYGMAGLPVVATRVGQCAEVLDQGRVGILVPPGAPEQLAEALLDLLYSPSRRAALGQKFQRHVKDHFSPEPVIMQICQVYDTVLESKKRPG